MHLKILGFMLDDWYWAVGMVDYRVQLELALLESYFEKIPLEYLEYKLILPKSSTGAPQRRIG